MFGMWIHLPKTHTLMEDMSRSRSYFKVKVKLKLSLVPTGGHSVSQTHLVLNFNILLYAWSNLSN